MNFKIHDATYWCFHSYIPTITVNARLEEEVREDHVPAGKPCMPTILLSLCIMIMGFLSFFLSLPFFSSFGVCCVFTVSATSSTISNNDTYIQNPSFPSAYGETNSLAYTIQKCSDGKMIYKSEKWNYNLFPIRFASLSDICWLRYDEWLR